MKRAWYFIGLTYKCAQAMGYEGNQYGPFNTKEDAEDIAKAFIKQCGDGSWGYAIGPWEYNE